MISLVSEIVKRIGTDFAKGKTSERQDNIDLALIITAIAGMLLVTTKGLYVIAMIPALVTFGLGLMDEHIPSKVINFCLSVGFAFAVYTQRDSLVLYITFTQVFLNFGMRVGRIDNDEAVVIQGLLSVVGLASALILFAAPEIQVMQSIANMLLFLAGIAGVYVALKMGNVIQGSMVSLIVGLTNLMGFQAGYPLLVGILNAGLFLFVTGSISRQLVLFVKKKDK